MPLRFMFRPDAHALAAHAAFRAACLSRIRQPPSPFFRRQTNRKSPDRSYSLLPYAALPAIARKRSTMSERERGQRVQAVRGRRVYGSAPHAAGKRRGCRQPDAWARQPAAAAARQSSLTLRRSERAVRRQIAFLRAAARTTQRQSAALHAPARRALFASLPFFITRFSGEACSPAVWR